MPFRRTRSPDRRAKILRRTSYAAVALAGLSALPAVQARGKALAVLAEALGFPFPRPFAAEVIRREVDLEGVTGDLYLPPVPAAAVILVPGAAPEGKDDERVVRLARSLARAERVVFVPDLELAQRRFVREDIERLIRSFEGLAVHESVEGGVSFVGFSYGGSFSLIAAADPRIADRVEQVAVFGAYFDLVGVVQAVTTGVSLVDGRRIEWTNRHPKADDILRRVGPRLVGAGERDAVEQALEGEIPAERLGAEASSAYRFLTAEDPEETFVLAEELSDEARDLLSGFSPSSIAGEIVAPVVALHSRDDPVVPYGELLRLEAGLPDARVVSVELFAHVDFDSGGDWFGAADDLWHSWRFTSWILSAQE